MRIRDAIVIGCAFALGACSLESMVDVDAPSNVVDPATVASKQGATQLYEAAVGRLAIAYAGSPTDYANLVVVTGLMSDELQTGALNSLRYFDTRIGLGGTGAGPRESFVYNFRVVSNARTSAQQARDALHLYYSDAPPAMFARLYTVEAYAILWLAENYCSGVPLSTVPLFGTPVQSRGYTTQELYDRATSLFDSARALVPDTSALATLARIGTARVHVALGELTEAAQLVSSVNTNFVFPLYFASTPNSAANAIGTENIDYQVTDGEGGVGLSWSSDPRAAVRRRDDWGVFAPAKYSITNGAIDAYTSAPATSVRLADGLEARLIEAEADLANGGSEWLNILNDLRASCVGAAACAPVPGLSADSLPALSDPGSPASRLDLLMQERAMWLYLTGHRLADQRRLVRLYHRDVASVYPSGTYHNPGFPGDEEGQPYGSDVVIRIDPAEEAGNTLYSGCLNAAP